MVKIFLLSLFLLSPVLGGFLPGGNLLQAVQERGYLSDNNINEVEGETRSLEDDLRAFLEILRKLMKEGNEENDIPPMEPIKLETAFDFFIEDTTLEGNLKIVVGNVSDFEVTNLTVTLPPKIKIKADVLFRELSINGEHTLVGLLFGEIPINDIGTHRISITNVTVSLDVDGRIKAGIPQITSLKADFDVGRISVLHGYPEKEVPETTVKDILNRFRLRYLPLLLNTGKIYLNDLFLRLLDKDEDFGRFLEKRLEIL